MDESLYDELRNTEQRHWWFVARRQIVQSLVERYANQKGRRLRICELGCGTGGNIAAWADRHDVVGVDMSKKALELARQRLGDRVSYGCLPDDISYAAESFDVVMLLDVLEHLEDDRGSAAKALSLLRPGGVLVATVPAYQWLYSPRDAHHHHFRRYASQAFRKLFQARDVQLEIISHYNTFLFPLAAAVRLWSKMFHFNSKPGDLKVPPALLNWLLKSLFAMERYLLPILRLPFGLSLIAVARKQTSIQQRLAA